MAAKLTQGKCDERTLSFLKCDTDPSQSQSLEKKKIPKPVSLQIYNELPIEREVRFLSELVTNKHSKKQAHEKIFSPKRTSSAAFYPRFVILHSENNAPL